MCSAERPAPCIQVSVEYLWHHAERIDAKVRQPVQELDPGNARQLSRGVGRQLPQLVKLRGRRKAHRALCLGRRRPQRPKGRLWYLDGKGHESRCTRLHAHLCS